MDTTFKTELHPFPPFMPEGARVLIMGTFPPKAARWSMPFYYPNLINDFWRITGLIFLGDKDALLLPGKRAFDLPKIKALLTEKGIALHDTGAEVRRLRDNASDKYLEIVRPVDLSALLRALPAVTAIATTGEKAAATLAAVTATEAPPMGGTVTATAGEPPRELLLSRLPSTSRAYPLALERKADYYRAFYHRSGLLR